ncbi:AEC family transporter [Roseibium sp. RKSG952]|uniref:AEC family transporter n=1 Tax=Roseibium sp. RKSG952 TaxID=2529384 RepID=UPI0012BBE9CF|nr:AEC family transporter [Roseibium sp. RKSG952]MTI00055.1 AEC family transporter [Roseibium sp. RKSG952]
MSVDPALVPLFKLLPDLALIGLGALLAKRIDPAGWRALDKLNFSVLFPALLFVAASSKPIALNDIFAIGFAAWGILGLGFAGGYVLRRYGPQNWVDFAGAWQTAWRFNTALAFVAVQAFPDSVAGFLAVAIGMAVPMANALAVGALTGKNGSPRKQVLEIAVNPFLVASLGGVVVGVTGIPVPEVPSLVAGRLADAALPLTLISIGAALDWSIVFRLTRFNAGLHAVKLFVLPGAVLAVCLATGVPGPICAALTLFSALPTASAAHVLAARYGADRTLVAGIVTQSSVIGCISLPLWCYVLLHLA